MTSPPAIVLDACVLVNFSLCHTLLRIAEPPSLFEPKWSREILDETARTLRKKLAWPQTLIEHFEKEIRAHFAEAFVTGYEPLIARLENHTGDRHVLAAAIHSGADTTVTFNLRHFPTQHLSVWGVTALHPEKFLIDLYLAATRITDFDIRWLMWSGPLAR